MAKFVKESMNDKSGKSHEYKYKKADNKEYPADLAYNNVDTQFKIYFVYDLDTQSDKERECVFEMKNSDGELTVFELPADKADIQAVVRTMFMY